MNETMGMMMMGGEATPENLRKAKAIIEELLGETKSENIGCGCCNKCGEAVCGKAGTIRAAVDLQKKEAERKDRMGEWIAEQINALLELAKEEGMDTADAVAEYTCGDIEFYIEA